MSPNPIPSSSTSTASTDPSTVSTEVPPIPPTTKRKLDDVIASLPVKAKSVKKTPRGANAVRTETEKLQGVAKFLVRAINPFLDISSVMQYGAAKNWGQGSSADLPASEIARQEVGAKAFDLAFANSEPELLDIVKHIFLASSSDPAKWESLVTMMRKSASSARTSDTGGLKHCLNYVLPHPSKQVLVPAITKQESKSDRGLTHPMLRYFIMGWSYRSQLRPLIIPAPLPRGMAQSIDPALANDDDDSENQSTAEKKLLQRIAGGRLHLLATDMPSCFWEEGKYNSANKDEGLLRGDIITRVLRHMWTAPNSALNGLHDGIPKICNARVHNQFVVTPEMIAIGCVHARTMISTREWTQRDDKYDYEKLFQTVLGFFAGLPHDPWAVETLEWYQGQVFGDAIDSDSGANSDDDPRTNEASEILLQRAARLSALANAAPASA
ncbi:hypothetical protein B0H16DRAFT_1493741 [Mycena metata]|uniref:Uncharacterized protein n=1 Tax=Mycena metata TaxID=1033252 RepID=A0AAD7P2A0_9AGAR|nr:hypothetical protein B0H16DRAFT_1493741 [Mycena metata]